MKLDQILSCDEAFISMEHYVDEGTRTFSPFASKSEATSQYQPRSDRPS